MKFPLPFKRNGDQINDTIPIDKGYRSKIYKALEKTPNSIKKNKNTRKKLNSIKKNWKKRQRKLPKRRNRDGQKDTRKYAPHHHEDTN